MQSSRKIKAGQIEVIPGAENFTGLTDTPSTYTGQGTKKVVVKTDETGLEFISDSEGIPEAPVDGELYGRKDANWEIIPTPTTPDLQAVLAAGSVASNKSIELGQTDGAYLLIEPTYMAFSAPTGGQGYIYWQSSAVDSVDFYLPLKPTGTETFAMLSDVEQILFSKNNAVLGSHTGTTSDTVLLNINIPAGTYAIGDWIPFVFDFTKIGTANSCTVRIRAGVTGTTGDTLIATNFLVAANLVGTIARFKMRFETGNLLVGLLNTNTAATDLINLSNANSSASLDPSADWILTVSASLGSSADEIQVTGYRVGKIKTF